ncbi:MAG: hypothetical protein E7459_07160 [Ruminococcaceae bacterium]|nr:hypothetical protein [Oscillospiraceae bacterium]
MHLDHDHIASGKAHTHTYSHTHNHEHGQEQEHDHAHNHTYTHAHDHGTEPHTHAIPGAHDHEHTHDHHDHDHDHTHSHEHDHTHEHTHCEQGAQCDAGSCAGCAGGCQHTPMEELTALMKYMVGHNASHARELAALAKQLESAGQKAAYEQVMLAVSDFEKGNLRLSAILQALS